MHPANLHRLTAPSLLDLMERTLFLAQDHAEERVRAAGARLRPQTADLADALMRARQAEQAVAAAQEAHRDADDSAFQVLCAAGGNAVSLLDGDAAALAEAMAARGNAEPDARLAQVLAEKGHVLTRSAAAAQRAWDSHRAAHDHLAQVRANAETAMRRALQVFRARDGQDPAAVEELLALRPGGS